MSFVSLRNVSKRYAGLPALNGASLSIASGEIHALIGENGAGKSTLIRILAGVVPPDAATIVIDGSEVVIDSPQTAFRLGLRFIHQELNVVPTLSVAENIFLGRPFPRRFAALVDWRRLSEEAGHALARLGISHIDPRRRMAGLTVGDRMIVSIAAAFLDDAPATARLYVMDEPTAALSGAEVQRLFAVLREIRQSGRSVLYVSHRLDEVMRLCDRATVLRDGAVMATVAVANTSRDQLIRLMIGRQVDEAYPPAPAPAGRDIALALDDLTGDGVGPIALNLRKGEIVGVAGLAGAGQSELLRLVMGAAPVRSGRIVLGGREQHRRGLTAAWQAGIAYVPHERRSEGLVLSRPIAENITLPHLARFSRGGCFLAPDRERAAADRYGAEVRLKARGSRQRCHELSGGNQQKVVFAKAIAGGPAVLLLDEPTRGVDVGAKFDIYSLIRRLSAAGMAVMMASSDLPELIGLCDRILVMRNGTVATELGTDGLTEQALLGHCYGAAAVVAPQTPGA